MKLRFEPGVHVEKSPRAGHYRVYRVSQKGAASDYHLASTRGLALKMAAMWAGWRGWKS